ncbi:hypothetical protein M885DRAFT_540963 [Pelagophyceae sp. CCMP2097]|nr:hypothetical protein M885DRAFT_540963 [Pelagophyceae sp. CCMP2097]
MERPRSRGPVPKAPVLRPPVERTRGRPWSQGLGTPVDPAQRPRSRGLGLEAPVS